jgi:SAM-dependent methyltransferase
MTPPERRSVDRQVRLAKVYDEEIVPSYAAGFAKLLLANVPFADLAPDARVLEVGCTTGHLTRELVARLGTGRRLTAVDESEAFLEEARARLGAGVALQLGSPVGLPVDEGTIDLLVSNLALAGGPDPAAAAREVARVLAPGGRVVMTGVLRGTWGEFLDLFRDVLREGGKSESVAALDAYAHSLPEGETLARWLTEAGLADVSVDVDRWEILFKSAREFFFSPLVELGPLSRWKRVSGRGDEMQDVFFFTKEAIDSYFKGRVFAVSVVAGAAIARRL